MANWKDAVGDKEDSYKAKTAKRPARPAPAMRAEFMSAAPVAFGLEPEPDPEVAEAPAEAVWPEA